MSRVRTVGRPLAVSAFLFAVAACVDSGTTRSVVQTGPPTLQAVQQAIFTPRCAVSGCHVAGGPFGLDLSAGAALGSIVGVASAEVPSLQRVVPGDAAESYLYMKVTGDTRILGDPMPAIPPALTDQQRQLIADWIDAGALP